jgi:hypothetical protein
LLYQDLIRTGQLTADGRLPPVLPVVLYNGSRPWDAARDVEELVVPVPGGMERYRPHLQYLLLDEARYTESELAPLRNLAAALFRMENSRTPDDVHRVLTALVEWLAAPQQDSLRRSFTVWLKRVFLPGRMPGVEFTDLGDLQGVRSMLAERVVEWTEQWKREGLEKGLQQGLQQGRKEGLLEGRQEAEAALLLRLLERRFGSLGEDVRSRVRAADAETLLRWGERLLTAESLDEILER